MVVTIRASLMCAIFIACAIRFLHLCSLALALPLVIIIIIAMLKLVVVVQLLMCVDASQPIANAKLLNVNVAYVEIYFHRNDNYDKQTINSCVVMIKR